ncbi:hypothetical protein OKW43_000578 [Paraburkholderia sp. WC7.3g]|uniref:DUF4123 domain-containing protein n=1 Tax=Paraburkholderia sp. WC7.3g TaxID=2991070 RepID=UPI003D21457E
MGQQKQDETAGKEECLLCRITYSIYSNFPPMPSSMALNAETGEWFPFDTLKSYSTNDMALAHAGPWLVDPKTAREHLADLGELEQARPGVIWLITSESLERQAAKLRPHLDTGIPKGRSALLRFWDPRVLHALNAVCHGKSERELFRAADAWQYLNERQRFIINDNGIY